MMQFKTFLFTCLILISVNNVSGNQHPKREFRGAWINTIGQGQYRSMNEKEMKQYFVSMLDQLQNAGINAVIFQVRPQADAFYISSIEPWSRYMTGTQGNAPSPLWDPLAFLIEESHKRNMELHAWLNPYRVTSSENESLASSHIYNSHPEWFVKYGKQIYFNPGLPQCRKYITEVVKDIVTRYDVDAIHMDDYFYPYPIAGLQFPDEEAFNTYRNAMGFNANQRDDWRRQNVNILIYTLNETIKKTKPWVRFGISQFGIYRNKRNTPDGSGSETNGLQNYDDLYADVLLWAEKGWIDYQTPQLYWEVGHKAACYDNLIYWWNNNSKGRHLYIGQSVTRSQDAADINPVRTQMNRKIELSRYLDNITGNCFWPGYDIINNYKNIANDLKAVHHSKPSMIPAYDFIDSEKPKEIRSLKSKWTENGYKLMWKHRNTKNEMYKQIYFCIYRFAEHEPVNLENGNKLIVTTRKTEYFLPYENGQTRYKYVVTAVNRMHNESEKGKSIKVSL